MSETRPRWLDEEPMIMQLLDTFITKAENGTKPSLKLTKKTVPELFNFQTEDVKYLWALVKALDKEFHIISIRLTRDRPGQEPYENAQVYFNPDKEDLVRDWLNRPAIDPYALVWQNTVAKLASKFEDGGQTLSETLFRAGDIGAEVIVKGFSRIGDELQRPISLRQLSARCFWGDSKFLDHREDLVRAIFPSSSYNLAPRPILMAVHLSDRIERVLFVENQDTFLALIKRDVPGLTLVYSGGFRGSASRIRNAGNVAFSYHSDSHETEALETFEDWWFNPDLESHIKPRFWGDMDFAGFSILRALREVFPHTEAWKAGYLPMLDRIRDGKGHNYTAAGKERQKDPDEIGCDFADLELLPEIRRSRQFLDQEAILMSELRVIL